MPPEENAADAADDVPDWVGDLRREMSAELERIRAANAEIVAERESQIAALNEEITALRAEVVRSATVPAPKTEPEPSAEEVYQKEVEINAELTLGLMKEMS